MPYIPRLKYVYMTFSTDITPSILINNGAVTKALATIVLPSLSGEIVGLWSEMRIASLEDSSASDNYLNGTQQIEMDVDAGGYDTILDMSGMLYCYASTQTVGALYTGDYIPVSSLTAGLTWGQTLTMQWKDTKAAGSNLYCYDCQVVVHLLVRF